MSGDMDVARAFLREERIALVTKKEQRGDVMTIVQALKNIDDCARKPHRTALPYAMFVSALFLGMALIMGTLAAFTRMQILLLVLLVAVAVYLGVWATERAKTSKIVRIDCARLNGAIRESSALTRAVRCIRENGIEPILMERLKKRIPQLMEGGTT